MKKTNSKITLTIESVKNDITLNIGKEVSITVIHRAKKVTEEKFEGTITGAFPSIFTVLLTTKDTKCFMYSDVMIGMVRYVVK